MSSVGKRNRCLEKNSLLQVPPVDGEIDYMLAVWDKGSGTGPMLRMLEYIDHIEQMDPQQRVMTTRDGERLTYGPSALCGCGSRLGSYNAWPNARMIGLPRPEMPWEYAGQTAA